MLSLLYLPPEFVGLHPDSMGRTIPECKFLVVSRDGKLCAPEEVGELVHRWSTVCVRYWNDSGKAARQQIANLTKTIESIKGGATESQLQRTVGQSGNSVPQPKDLVANVSSNQDSVGRQKTSGEMQYADILLDVPTADIDTHTVKVSLERLIDEASNYIDRQVAF